MSGPDRRLVSGAAIIVACSVGVFAAYNFVVDPMAADLDATRSQAVLLRQLPTIGTLLVVFLIGTWGSRLGMKRVITASALVMTLGYLIVLVAPVVPVVTLGMLLGSIGKMGIGVVSVSLIAARLTRDGDRATGFAALGLAAPVGYLVVPILAGLLLDATNWRAVVGLWVVLAATAAFFAWRLLPPDEQGSGTGEMWTPALAGLVLVGLIQSTRNISQEGLADPRTVFWSAVTIVAMVTLWQLMVRLPQPSLDLSLFQRGGAVLLLIVVALVPFANLFYYFAVGVQRLYGYSGTEAALLLVPCQLAGIAGAWIARGWLRRLGMRMAGTLMLFGISAALFLSSAQTVDTPVIYPVLVLSLFALAYTGGGVVVTNAMMNLAPAGKEGSASATRSAASSFGQAVGMALSAFVFFGAAQSTMQDLVAQRDGDWAEAAQVIDEFRDATTTREEIAESYGLSVDVVTTHDEEWLESQLAGYRAQGLLGGCVGLVATFLFFTNRRGLRRVEEEEDEEDPDRTRPAR